MRVKARDYSANARGMLVKHEEPPQYRRGAVPNTVGGLLPLNSQPALPSTVAECCIRS